MPINYNTLTNAGIELIDRNASNRDEYIKLNEDQKEKKDNSKIEIVLDGPLSSIYTKALNLVYSQESAGTMNELLDACLWLGNGQSPDEGHKKYLIYVSDGEKIDEEEYNYLKNKLNVSLSSENYTGILVSLETNTPNQITNKVYTLCKNNNVKLFFKRESCLNDIINLNKK